MNVWQTCDGSVACVLQSLLLGAVVNMACASAGLTACMRSCRRISESFASAFVKHCIALTQAVRGVCQHYDDPLGDGHQGMAGRGQGGGHVIRSTRKPD